MLALAPRWWPRRHQQPHLSSGWTSAGTGYVRDEAAPWSGRRKDTPDIRTLAGLRREKTDQEIADDELGDPIALVIPTEEWRGVWWRRTQLLNAAELGGAGAAADWLTERSIRWELPPPKVQAWRPEVEVTRELLRRSARTVLRT